MCYFFILYPAPRCAMAATTTIRLPPKLRAPLGALAKQTGRSAHSLIVEAVERHAAYAEQIRSPVKDAVAAGAEDHIERAIQFLPDENPDAARSAATAIQSAVDNLAAHPLVGRRLEGELRELIISLGHSGHVALYRFMIAKDEVRILAIRRQREIGYFP